MFTGIRTGSRTINGMRHSNETRRIIVVNPVRRRRKAEVGKTKVEQALICQTFTHFNTMASRPAIYTPKHQLQMNHETDYTQILDHVPELFLLISTHLLPHSKLFLALTCRKLARILYSEIEFFSRNEIASSLFSEENLDQIKEFFKQEPIEHTFKKYFTTQASTTFIKNVRKDEFFKTFSEGKLFSWIAATGKIELLELFKPKELKFDVTDLLELAYRGHLQFFQAVWKSVGKIRGLDQLAIRLQVIKSGNVEFFNYINKRFQNRDFMLEFDTALASGSLEMLRLVIGDILPREIATRCDITIPVWRSLESNHVEIISFFRNQLPELFAKDPLFQYYFAIVRSGNVALAEELFENEGKCLASVIKELRRRSARVGMIAVF